MELEDGQIVWSNKLPKFKDEAAAFLAGLLNVSKVQFSFKTRDFLHRQNDYEIFI